MGHCVVYDIIQAWPTCQPSGSTLRVCTARWSQQWLDPYTCDTIWDDTVSARSRLCWCKLKPLEWAEFRAHAKRMDETWRSCRCSGRPLAKTGIKSRHTRYTWYRIWCHQRYVWYHIWHHTTHYILDGWRSHAWCMLHQCIVAQIWASSKTHRSIGITAQYPASIRVSAEFESYVLTTCHAFIRKQLHQHLRHFALDVLKSIPLLPHVNAFDATVLDCLHPALVHIMVDLICIEIWMVNDPLYMVFQFSCVDIVSTDVFLKNAFALREDVGSIHVQRWQVFCLYPLQHSPFRNHHRRLHWNVLQQQLDVSCVDACGNVIQKSSKNLSVFFQIRVLGRALISKVTLLVEIQDSVRVRVMICAYSG